MQFGEVFSARVIRGSFRACLGTGIGWRAVLIAATFLVALCALQPAHAQLQPPSVQKTNGKLAYSDVIDQGSASVRRAIFVHPGGQLTHPVPDRESDSAPAWSADGTRIAWARFVREAVDQPGEWTIMVADADGTNERVILRQRNPDGTLIFGSWPTCVPKMLSWSPDSFAVGIGAECPGGYKGFYIGAVTPSESPGGFTNMFLTAPGFDWGPTAVVFRCSPFNAPSNENPLFCSGVDSAFAYTAIERDLSDPSTQGFTTGVPRWIDSPYGRRVAFVYSSGSPTNASKISPSIYTIEPARSNQQPIGALLERFSGDPEFVACTPPDAPTQYRARYDYPQIAPSPDGRYIAVRRTEFKSEVSGSNGTVGCREVEVENGIYILRRGGALQNTVVVGKDVRDPAWQPGSSDLTVSFKDVQNHELHGMKVELYRMTDGVLTPTNIVPSNTAGGQYQFENVPEGTYHVRAALQDIENSAFDVRYDYFPGSPKDAPVSADFVVVVGPSNLNKDLVFSILESDLAATSVDGSASLFLGDLAVIYYNTATFVNWAKNSLGADLRSSVAVHAFATSGPDGRAPSEYGAGYFARWFRIIMSTNASLIDSRDDDGDECPLNCEWHEYTHHMDFLNRLMGSACVPLAGDSNHGGYANSSTCDSLNEGIASFLPAMFTGNPDYAGVADLEDHIKAWHVGFGFDGKTYPREDLAVAALLWDLVDDDADVLHTSAVAPGTLPQHVPVAYDDDVAIPLTTLWQILGTQQPGSVRALQQHFNGINSAPLVDLDGDGTSDINVYDSLFLMHGFYQTLSDDPAPHYFHYNIGHAREVGQASNDDVGLSSHRAFNLLGFTGPDRLYREQHPSGDINLLGVSVRDASGTPLAGAAVHIDLQYPDADRRITRRLASGDGSVVRLQLPQYFDYLPTDGALPECALGTLGESQVGVVVTAELNGFASTNWASFDNCLYLTAAMNAPVGTEALSYTLEFPEDSVAPTTTAQPFGQGQVNGSNATESWAVQLDCADPEIGGFASGCNRSEYRINGGPLQVYEDGDLSISGDGEYTVEFHSVDAAANEESWQQIQLTIGTAPPAIASFTPASGPVGTRVDIAGTDFLGVTAVRFNGTDAAFTVVSSTSITATVPAGATSGPISVTGPGGAASTSTDFTVPPAPSIDGFSPPFAAVSFSVTVTGSNFTGTTRVAFNGTPAGFTVGATGTQLVATVPFGATSGPITVQTPGGTATSATSFVVTNGIPPAITSFSPTSGSVGAGVTIRGDNLTGATSVTFNGVSASFRYKGSTLVATVPAGTTTGRIRVTTAGGWATTATDFVVNLPPVIQSIAPTSGAVGTTVTVTGSQFNGVTAVKFGSVSASFAVVSPTTITATVPRRAKTGPISVTTAAGTAVSAGSFTVVP